MAFGTEKNKKTRLKDTDDFETGNKKLIPAVPLKLHRSATLGLY